ncbi:GATA transcription factor 19-like [Primulina eburnea]|uniref:GATA transcription factor 19-like n=1 Tax=Primulina eburnea TaxID=1245227 RepID=UPI003C6BDEDB
MMHRCGSSNMVGGCTCGMYHPTRGNSFSMLFSKNNDGYLEFDEGDMYSFATNSPPSSVDCSLSLGTPSTRLISNEKKRSSCIPGFGWNNFPASKHMSSPPTTVKSHRGGSNIGHSGRDPLVARRCANCDTTSTPLWRNGPRGPKSLCNACGIRFKKEERRATAAASITNGGGGDSQNAMNDSWAAPPQRTLYHPPSYKNEFRFAEEDDHRNSISWRFNVTDRPSLVPNFTS